MVLVRGDTDLGILKGSMGSTKDKSLVKDLGSVHWNSYIVQSLLFSLQIYFFFFKK